MLPKLPDILNDAKDALVTNFPPDQLGDMLDGRQARRRQEHHPQGPQLDHDRPPLSTTGGIYLLKLDMKKLAKFSVDLFGEDSRYYVPPAASGASPSPAAP